MTDSDQSTARRVTRLAPSPTGALHLGNARTFLITWAIARQRGWKIYLRIEDLDTPRVKADSARQIIETLKWLGMDWDAWESGESASDNGVLVQTRELDPYRAAMRVLCSPPRGTSASTLARAYPCSLSRTEIEAAASAPQEGSHETPFPAALRPEEYDQSREFLSPWPENEATNWRFVVPDGVVRFDDEVAGPQSHEPARSIGDFVLWTKRDQPSYQLAVVVDDHRQGVTDVIRGDDLLDSAARQLLLYRALGLRPEPRYWHLPLVVGTDGRRLAKRHGDTRIDHYRAMGVPAEGVIGLIAHWSGIRSSALPVGGQPTAGQPVTMNAEEFLARFDLATMPRQPVIFTDEDDRWLRAQRRG